MTAHAEAPAEVAPLVLLASSPRVAPGLLSREAWRVLEAAGSRLAAASDEPLALAVGDAGLAVVVDDRSVPEVARALVDAAVQARAAATDEGVPVRPVVWLGSADADPGLSDAIAADLSRLDDPPAVEVLVGSWDVAGARLLDAVAVMDRLRSPGGCPWDAEQTHESLVRYLHEEAGEVEEAVVALRPDPDDPHLREDLRDELGDVLLQVLFHARVGEEHAGAPFDIDDVAATLVAKLVRRHPHVFGGSDASTPEEVEAQWAQIKADERAAKQARRGTPSSD